MPLRVTFDLEDKDLKYFRDVLKRAQETAKKSDEADILSAAKSAVDATAARGVPVFVKQRLDQISQLISMSADPEWALEAKERENVMTALAYFSNPEDIIPDSVPVLGYIDDAIMIELVVRELRPELDAFADFCQYRRDLKARNLRSDVSRQQWLEEKRRALFARMRRRHRAVGSRSTSARPLRLF